MMGFAGCQSAAELAAMFIDKADGELSVRQLLRIDTSMKSPFDDSYKSTSDWGVLLLLFTFYHWQTGECSL